MHTQIFTGGRLVLRDAVVEGTLTVRDGVIEAIEPGRSHAPGAIDLEGDYLTPGLVELHTDRLEQHIAPRPGVRWPARAALIAQDAEMLGAGITTVFDSIAVGSISEDGLRAEILGSVMEGLAAAHKDNMLQADHFLHLRCEVSCHDVVEMFDLHGGSEKLRLVSLMDHTPGQRQFVRIDKYKQYYMGKYRMKSDDFDVFMAEKRAQQEKYAAPNRVGLVARCRERGLFLASHDDATAAHVDEAIADGVSVAEFPTTVEAAKASHDAGIRVMGGAPNLVRGGSHSGNIAVLDLAKAGALDLLSSDYVPTSLLFAAFTLAESGVATLPQAMATVTATPAEAVGLADRGALETGRRADVIRVRAVDGQPLVRGVWVAGARVA
ncbi:MAG: alpha-D-ribose 1-methylphosphonate 5-triphosphate diphosphatase [Elsteraceae bacterium]